MGLPMNTSHHVLALVITLGAAAVAYGCSSSTTSAPTSSADGGSGSSSSGGTTQYASTFSIGPTAVAGSFQAPAAASDCVTTMGLCKLSNCSVSHPATLSAGTVTLSGGQLASNIVLQRDATLGTYGASLTAPAFDTGDTFMLSATGGDVAAFSAVSPAAPPDIVLTAPVGTADGSTTRFAIDTSKDLDVVWTGGDTSFEVNFELANLDDATKDLAVRCQFDAEIGSGLVPAALLGALGTPASGSLTAQSIVTNTTPAANGNVTLELSTKGASGVWGK